MNQHSNRHTDGREAARPERASRRILRRVWAGIGRHHLSIVAAGVAFFGVLAIFPAIAALIAVYGLVATTMQEAARNAQVDALVPATAR